MRQERIFHDPSRHPDFGIAGLDAAGASASDNARCHLELDTLRLIADTPFRPDFGIDTLALLALRDPRALDLPTSRPQGILRPLLRAVLRRAASLTKAALQPDNQGSGNTSVARAEQRHHRDRTVPA